tara:strand:+ start:87 stop:581 length:495 start_codon:yes stop_codon:yes gene_type:complete
MSNIPSFADMYPSRWLKAEDIMGREIIATIESIGQEEFDRRDDDKRGPGAPDKKNVLRFVGAEKEFILNMTNGKTIFAAFGEPVGWIGKKVVLFTMEVQQPSGGTAPGIRLRAHLTPEAMASAASAPPADEIAPPVDAATALAPPPPAALAGAALADDDDSLPF